MTPPFPIFAMAFGGGGGVNGNIMFFDRLTFTMNGMRAGWGSLASPVKGKKTVSLSSRCHAVLDGRRSGTLKGKQRIGKIRLKRSLKLGTPGDESLFNQMGIDCWW